MKALKISHLTKTYYQMNSEKTVVKDLCLEIDEGEVFGFLGPNGAGKTTTVKMIVGLAHPDSGTIEILGQPHTDLNIKTQIGFMSETPYFYAYLTGFELLDFFGQLFPMSAETRIKRARNLLTQVGLKDAADLAIRKYSKGMNQRLGVAAALINDPKVVFLDEPLDGLDPLGRRHIKEIILNLKKRGKTVFFNSHILSDVEEICDNIGIIDEGKLIAEGNPKKLSARYKNLEEYFVSLIETQRKKK